MVNSIKNTRAKLSAYIQGSNLFKSAFGSLVLKISAGGVMFLASIVLARLLGPKEFGIYSIAMAAVILFGTVASMGLPPLITREVARYEAHAQWSSLKGIIISTHRWTLSAILVLIVLGVTSVAIGWPLPELSWQLAVPAFIMLPLFSLGQVRSGILRGLHWVVLADVPDMLLRPFMLLLAAGFVFFYSGKAVAHEAMLMHLLSQGGAFILGFWFLKQKTTGPVRQARAEHHHEHWIKEAQPFFWMTLVILLDGQVGLYMLGWLAEPEQAGILQVALQLMLLISIGLSAVNAPLQPKLAAALSKNDNQEAQRLLSEAAKLGTLVAMLAAFVVIPFANEVVLLFGKQYADAANVLRIIVLGQLINAMAGSSAIALNVSGNQKITLTGMTISLLANVIFCYVFIPQFQALGAAIAFAASMVIWNFMLAYKVKIKLMLYTPINLSKDSA